MSLSKRVLASIASGALLLGALAAPAAAHEVKLEQMYMSKPVFGAGGVNTQMWLSIEDHPGTVRITLLKKNKDGDWVKIATHKATYQVGWGYTYTFDPVKGDKRCKARGVFTKKNHTTVKGVSKVGAC